MLKIFFGFCLLGLSLPSFVWARTSLRVLTFNVQQVPNSPYRAERLDIYCKQLRAQVRDAEPWDLIAHQELWLGSGQKKLSLKCGYPYAATREYEKFTRSGLHLLSRLPVREIRHLYFTENGSWFDFEPAAFVENFLRKGAIAARVQLPEGQTVWFVGLHTVAEHKFDYNEQRRGQIREVEKWLTEINPMNHPFIIAGDWNLDLAKSEWAEFLKQTFPGIQWAPEAGTVNTYGPPDVWSKDSKPEALDHLLFSWHFQVRHGRRVFDQPFTFKDGANGHLSDHMGFETVAELK